MNATKELEKARKEVADLSMTDEERLASKQREVENLKSKVDAEFKIEVIAKCFVLGLILWAIIASVV